MYISHGRSRGRSRNRVQSQLRNWGRSRNWVRSWNRSRGHKTLTDFATLIFVLVLILAATYSHGPDLGPAQFNQVIPESKLLCIKCPIWVELLAYSPKFASAPHFFCHFLFFFWKVFKTKFYFSLYEGFGALFIIFCPSLHSFSKILQWINTQRKISPNSLQDLNFYWKQIEEEQLITSFFLSIFASYGLHTLH